MLDDRIVRAIIGAVREQDRSGYEIWHWLGAVHGDHGAELTEANLYPTLYRMEAQRLIQGEWQEGDQIRRLYRVATRATKLAQARGWQPLARPLRPDPAAVDIADQPSPVTPALPMSITEYVDRLDAALELSEPSRTDVRSEIRDHLEDSAAEYGRAGIDPEAAAQRSIARLGQPEELGRAINRGQVSRRRLLQAMGTAGVAALYGAGVGLAFAAIAVLIAPVLAKLVVSLIAGIGLHLYLPYTDQYRSQQLGAAAWVAAFLAARRSTPVIAEISHRSERSIVPFWALAGALPLLAVALFAPIQMDVASTVAYLGLPVAFAVGTWRRQRPGDDLVSRRGIAQAAVLLLVFLFPPGIRLWYFQPSSPTAQPASVVASDARLDIDMWGGTVQGANVDAATWRDARIAFWPAIRRGLEVVPDGSATSPSVEIQPGDAPTLGALPDGPDDWWVVLTAVGNDGFRHTLDAQIIQGSRRSGVQTIVGWLEGLR
jgi:hypothetical protein